MGDATLFLGEWWELRLVNEGTLVDMYPKDDSGRRVDATSEVLALIGSEEEFLRVITKRMQQLRSVCTPRTLGSQANAIDEMQLRLEHDYHKLYNTLIHACECIAPEFVCLEGM